MLVTVSPAVYSNWLQLIFAFIHQPNSLFCLRIYFAQFFWKYKWGWLCNFLQGVQNCLQSAVVSSPSLPGGFRSTFVLNVCERVCLCVAFWGNSWLGHRFKFLFCDLLLRWFYCEWGFPTRAFLLFGSTARYSISIRILVEFSAVPPPGVPGVFHLMNSFFANQQFFLNWDVTKKPATALFCDAYHFWGKRGRQWGLTVSLFPVENSYQGAEDRFLVRFMVLLNQMLLAGDAYSFCSARRPSPSSQTDLSPTCAGAGSSPVGDVDESKPFSCCYRGWGLFLHSSAVWAVKFWAMCGRGLCVTLLMSPLKCTAAGGGANCSVRTVAGALQRLLSSTDVHVPFSPSSSSFMFPVAGALGPPQGMYGCNALSTKFVTFGDGNQLQVISVQRCCS